jgi:hypothetical protein
MAGRTKIYGTEIRSGSIPTFALGGGVVSSSAQLPSGIVSSSAQLPGGIVSSSAQLPAGTISSSTQTVTNIAGQTVTPAIINATGVISGASIQTSGNGTIGGNLTVATNTLFVTSSGNVGIGTTIPSASLHVSGTIMIQGVIERANITGSAPPTTLNLDAISGSVFYLSGSSANNWTVNFRGSAATSLNTIMYNGQSMTFAVLVNHGATGYTASAHQVDGASITPRWQGGTVPSGSGTSTDIYSYTLIKTGNAAFNIFASQTKFA